jgi:hypothetical protein
MNVSGPSLSPGPRPANGLAQRIAVVCLAVATSIAFGVVPAAADGFPSLTVDPSTGLSGGVVVHVTASGLFAGADVRIIQCDEFNDDFEMDCWPTTVIAVADDGSVTTDVTLADPVPRNTFTGDADWVYCRADICRLFLVWDDADGVTQVLASPPLEFTGSPATIVASPSTNLHRLQWVRAQGTAYGGEGRSFQLVEEACYWIVQGRGCYASSLVGSGVVGSDGSWSKRVRVSRFLVDGTDCTNPDILGGCQLTVRILDASGNPDNTFGVATIGQQRATLTFRRCGRPHA